MKITRTITFSIVAFFFLSLCYLPSAVANPVSVFNDNVQISDGKNGRIWNKWSRQVDGQTIVKVIATLRKISGGDDTFVNLRFDKQSAFENGKKVNLANGQTSTAVWNVGQKSNGRPLVLNAYNGVVQVSSVRVFYQTALLSSGNSNGQINSNRHPRERHKGRPNPHYNSGQQQNQLGSSNSSINSQNNDATCQQRNYNNADIEVFEAKSSGGLFSGKYRIYGSITGSCIEEAGYYENGRLKEKFNVPLTSRFSRKEFQFQVRTGKNAEIRAYTTGGGISRISVDDYIARQKSNSNNNNSNTGGLSWP